MTEPSAVVCANGSAVTAARTRSVGLKPFDCFPCLFPSAEVDGNSFGDSAAEPLSERRETSGPRNEPTARRRCAETKSRRVSDVRIHRPANRTFHVWLLSYCLPCRRHPAKLHRGRSGLEIPDRAPDPAVGDIDRVWIIGGLSLASRALQGIRPWHSISVGRLTHSLRAGRCVLLRDLARLSQSLYGKSSVFMIFPPGPQVKTLPFQCPKSIPWPVGVPFRKVPF